MTGKIDDPFDAARSQYPEARENKPGELAITISGAVIPLIGFVATVREHYSRIAVEERLRVLIDAVNSKTNAVSAKVDNMSSANSSTVAEAVRLTIEETWRTTDVEKVKKFGAILGGTLATNDDPDSLQDCAEFIRAVAQLGERDIQALKALYSPVADIMHRYTNLHDPNPFVDQWQDVLRAAAEAKLVGDSFYSSCKRLEGFGLAIELPRNPSRIAPGDYSFRPTRRGERLLVLLGYLAT